MALRHNAAGGAQGAGTLFRTSLGGAAAGTFTAGGRIEDKDGGSTEYTAAVEVVNPRQGIDLLIQKVNDLVAAGVLNADPAGQLLHKLDLAAKHLDKGQPGPAINSQVTTMMSLPATSPSRIARRLGSARARKTVSWRCTDKG